MNTLPRLHHTHTDTGLDCTDRHRRPSEPTASCSVNIMADKRHIQHSHDMTASNFDEIGANPIRDNNRRRGLDVRWSTESQLVRRSRAERPTERTVSDQY